MTAAKRVLQVIHSLHFGGAENVVAQLATGMNREEFDVRVACTRESGRIGEQITAAGITVTSATPTGRLSHHLAPLRMLRVIREFRPHVVHSHGIVAISAIGPLARLGLLPRWIHTFHYGNYPYANRRHMWVEGLYARGARELIAVAGRQRDAVIRYHRLRPERVVVVPNGVRSNPHLGDPAVRNAKRAELGLGERDFVVGTVCVLSEQKGVPYFLEAAARLAPLHPQMRFLIVGGGPMEAELRAEAARRGLGTRVLFTGWRADVQELLMTLDVWVMASLWEAMPLALLEAMAARRPMIVTDVGDNAALVGHGECALVIPPRDALALGDAVERLQRDPALAGGLAARALRTFESRFTVGEMIRAHERMYRSAPGVSP